MSTVHCVLGLVQLLCLVILLSNPTLFSGPQCAGSFNKRVYQKFAYSVRLSLSIIIISHIIQAFFQTDPSYSMGG